ncbi:MAG: hypothetical protein ABI204_02315 [Ginsengibacter sp.]
MGLSIHYTGELINREILVPLIEEVADICQSLEWKFKTIDDDEIKGICFSPKGSEPVCLTFNEEGRTLSPINIMVKEIYDGVQLPKDLYFTASTKTQYAGIDAHIAIIKLLKYISKKYLAKFTVTDEGYYWETGDEKLLLEQFEKYNVAVNTFRKAFENLQSIPGESPESLGDRIERILREKLGGKED